MALLDDVCKSYFINIKLIGKGVSDKYLWGLIVVNLGTESFREAVEKYVERELTKNGLYFYDYSIDVTAFNPV